MFSTLKTIQEGDRAVLETIEAPPAKPRERSLVRVACLTCRACKLKCSGERDGCGRCLSKHLTCQYPRSRRAGSLSKSLESSHPPPTDPESSLRTSTSPADTSNQVSMDDGADGHPGYRSFQQVASLPDFTSHSPGLPFDPSFFLPEEVAWPHEDGAQTLALEEDHGQRQSGPQPATTTHPKEHHHPGEAVLHSNTLLSPCDLFASPGDHCECLLGTLGVYEGLMLAVYHRNQTSDNGDVLLAAQKQALTQCHSVLSCARCTFNTAALTLLLMVCTKVAESLALLTEAIAVPDLAQTTPAVSPPLSSGGDWRTVANAAVTHVNEFRALSQSARLGSWHGLDDDDHGIVVRSLLQARRTKLVDVLEKMIQSEGLRKKPFHKAMTREVMLRLG